MNRLTRAMVATILVGVVAVGCRGTNTKGFSMKSGACPSGSVAPATAPYKSPEWQAPVIPEQYAFDTGGTVILLGSDRGQRRSTLSLSGNVTVFGETDHQTVCVTDLALTGGESSLTIGVLNNTDRSTPWATATISASDVRKSKSFVGSVPKLTGGGVTVVGVLFRAGKVPVGRAPLEPPCSSCVPFGPA